MSDGVFGFQVDGRLGQAADTLQQLIDGGEEATYDFAFIGNSLYSWWSLKGLITFAIHRWPTLFFAYIGNPRYFWRSPVTHFLLGVHR